MTGIHGIFLRPAAVAVVALLAALPAVAEQTVPPGLDPGILLEQEKKLKHPQFPPAGPPVIKPAPAVPGKEEPAALRIRLKEIRLEGAITRFSREELLGLVQDLIGREVALQELQQAADRITAHYREHGYFLARAVLPKQDITEGVVRITILEGALEDIPGDGGIRIDGTMLRLREERIRGTIREAAPPGKALKQSELERGLLILNDLPGISSSANLEPGSAVGTTRLALDVKEGPLFNALLGLDNFGNRFTGSHRFTGGINLNDPGRSGDQLILAGNKAISEDYYYLNVAYTRPLGYSGLLACVAYSQLAFELGKELETLQSKGDARNVTLTARYPLLRNRSSSLFFSVSHDWKALTNSALGVETSNKRVNVVGAGLNWYGLDSFGGGGFSQVGLFASAGDLDLRVPADQAADRAGARTEGFYKKISFSAARIQKISGTVDFTLAAGVQVADKNLDSSEKLTLGGPAGVRAYPVSEAIGDDGIRGSAELKWNVFPGASLGDLQLSSFYDIGYIHQFHRLWPGAGLTTPNSYTLQGAGLGAVLGKPGKYDLRLQYAWKIGGNPGRNAQGNDADGRSDSSRVWFTASVMF